MTASVNPVVKQIVGYTSFVLLTVVAFTVLFMKLSVAMVLGGTFILAFLFFMVFYPEAGTLVVTFLIYSNVAVVAYKFHGVPHLAVAAGSLLICVPFAVYVLVMREKVVLDYPLLLMFLYLASLLISSFFAKDIGIALDRIVTFLMEGLVLYFLLINVIRKVSTLDRVIWAMLIAGTVLGGMTLFQEATTSYNQQFWGLAQRNLEYGFDDGSDEVQGNVPHQSKVRRAQRASGPTGDPNRFAQILLVLFPLGFFRFLREHSLTAKILLGLCTLLILSGVLLTYSRGAFVTIIVLMIIMTIMRYIKFSYAIGAGILLLSLILITSPGYFTRMDTIRGVKGLFTTDTEHQPDSVTRGRVTEMLAAFMVFLDHPLFGVGPGQYTPFYSMSYMSNPDIAFRRIDTTRRAHTLYFELAAETGIMGLSVFLLIVFLVVFKLWDIRSRLIKTQPDLANLATSFILAIAAYLGTAIFLQLSYERYYWLLLGVAAAAIQVLDPEKLEKQATATGFAKILKF